MGLPISKDRFEEAEFSCFAARLRDQLDALSVLLCRENFGVSTPSVGVELEMSLVSADGRPLPNNEEVLLRAGDPRCTAELNRFNIECNSAPTSLSGTPLTTLRHELDDAVDLVRRAARTIDGRVALVGILPTLVQADLQSSAMTDQPRYRALSAGILRLRQRPFRVRIDGEDPLHVECNDVTFEGANTSLQIHLRVNPADFCATYNAAQLAMAPALAASGNSPTFLGHRLWEETRVALFKQSVDDRAAIGPERGVPRVCFGTRWLRESPIELVRECVEVYEPLLPVMSDEDARAVVRRGGVPELEELRLHLSTVWRWNRPVYDPADGGHLRIEMRALPSGPTTWDMVANVAFWIGLSREIALTRPSFTEVLPFEAARVNFYRAAQLGLDADISWPTRNGMRTAKAHELVLSLLPAARRGLLSAGVPESECSPYLDLLEARVLSKKTGARWQRERLRKLEERLDRRRALAAMLEEYLDLSERGSPVHDWPLS